MSSENLHNEKELLSQVAQGNEVAFKQLVRQYSPVLFHFIYLHTDSEPVAEEIVQDILVQVWITRESLPEIRNFRKWLFILARNHAINALKRIVRERNFKKGISANEEAAEERDHLQEDHHIALIEEAVRQLPEKQRQAWELSRRESKTYNEVAVIMNVSRETVKTHLHLANAAITKFVTERLDIWLLLVLLKKIS